MGLCLQTMPLLTELGGMFPSDSTTMPPLTGLDLRFGGWAHHQALAGPGYCPRQGCFC